MKNILWGLLLMALAGLVFALTNLDDQGNPNDPRTNERANACYEGGTLAFRCHATDVDGDGSVTSDEVETMWVAGWYLIRFEAGMIPRESFPPQYAWLLPAAATPASNGLAPLPDVPTLTPTPGPSLTPSNTPTPTPSASPSNTPTVTSTPSPSPSPVPTNTFTPTFTPTP